MEKTLQVIIKLEQEGVIKRYALGGATALLFYAEPSLTFDIDIFVFLPEGKNHASLIDLGPLYKALRSKGYHAEKEHVMIEGIPVQFIPVYNALVEEAVREALEKDYQGVRTRVVRIEHLLAIMIDTNRPKDRERIRSLLSEVSIEKKRFREILNQHALSERWEKEVGNIEEGN